MFISQILMASLLSGGLDSRHIPTPTVRKEEHEDTPSVHDLARIRAADEKRARRISRNLKNQKG